MKKWLVLSLVLACAPTAWAAVVFSDNFESYTDQASFEAVWPPVTAGQSGTWSADQSYSPTHSVFFPKTPLAKNNYHNVPETAASDVAPVELSFRFYDSVIANNRNYVQLHDAAPALTQLLSLGTYNAVPGATVTDMNTYYAARVAFLPGGGTAPGWFLLNAAGVQTRTVGWHELKVVIKGMAVDYYVDGTLGKADVPYLSGVGTASFDHIRLNSGLTSANDAYIDDVNLSVVPEPATLALLVIGGLAAVRRRR